MSINEDSTADANRSLMVIGIVVALAVGFLAYRLMHPATVFAADGLDGHWDAAVEHSREAHLPSLVLFTADWCPGCRSLHAEVLSRSEIDDEIAAHYTMATVDVTNPNPVSSARMSKYHVSGIPTLIRFNAEGKETDRTHFLPPDKMLAWLRGGMIGVGRRVNQPILRG